MPVWQVANEWRNKGLVLMISLCRVWPALGKGGVSSRALRMEPTNCSEKSEKSGHTIDQQVSCQWKCFIDCYPHEQRGWEKLETKILTGTANSKKKFAMKISHLWNDNANKWKDMNEQILIYPELFRNTFTETHFISEHWCYFLPIAT